MEQHFMIRDIYVPYSCWWVKVNPYFLNKYLTKWGCLSCKLNVEGSQVMAIEQENLCSHLLIFDWTKVTIWCIHIIIIHHKIALLCPISSYLTLTERYWFSLFRLHLVFFCFHLVMELEWASQHVVEMLSSKNDV